MIDFCFTKNSNKRKFFWRGGGGGGVGWGEGGWGKVKMDGQTNKPKPIYPFNFFKLGA